MLDTGRTTLVTTGVEMSRMLTWATIYQWNIESEQSPWDTSASQNTMAETFICQAGLPR